MSVDPASRGWNEHRHRHLVDDVTLTDVQTLTNKTLNSPTINTPTLSGSGGVLALPAGPDTLVGRATTDTLVNKTLTSPVVSGVGGTPAGTLGFSGTILQVGDGTLNAGINVGAWTTFTPTLAQLTAVAATVNIAHYLKIGRRVEIFIQMTATAAGTAGNPIIVTTLPAAILPLTNNTSVVTGWGYVLIAAPARIGALLAFASGQLEILIDNAGVLGVTPSVALANGSIVTMWGSWETAS